MTSPPLAAIALLSAAALGYEILLMRLFSIILWHHFAYMMISVAMLGYGAAGTFVALAQRFLLRRYEVVFSAAATLFGITAVAGFLLAQRVAFDPLEMLWDPRQPLRLLVIYALLFVPFFCAATSICLTFARFADQPHRIYSFDILGAGAGALSILIALFATTPSGALQWISALGLAALAVSIPLTWIVLGAVVGSGLPRHSNPAPGPVELLPQALRASATRTTAALRMTVPLRVSANLPEKVAFVLSGWA